jgi:hypothetical protein
MTDIHGKEHAKTQGEKHTNLCSPFIQHQPTAPAPHCHLLYRAYTRVPRPSAARRRAPHAPVRLTRPKFTHMLTPSLTPHIAPPYTYTSTPGPQRRPTSIITQHALIFHLASLYHKHGLPEPELVSCNYT